MVLLGAMVDKGGMPQAELGADPFVIEAWNIKKNWRCELPG